MSSTMDVGWGLVRVKPAVGDEAGYKANPAPLELTRWRQQARTLPTEYKMMCSELLPFLPELPPRAGGAQTLFSVAAISDCK